MAKAEFKTPIVEREVVLTMTESQAHKLRTILGMSKVSATQSLGDLTRVLLDPVPRAVATVRSRGLADCSTAGRIMETIYQARLRKLADFLDTLPKEAFYFGSWVENWSGGSAMNASCGTTACAFGWATAIPEFQVLGLRLCDSKYGGVGLTMKPTPPQYGSWAMTVEAAKDVFDLDENEMTWLFTPSDYNRDEDEGYDNYGTEFGRDGKPYTDVAPSVVAEHIRNFLNGVSQ